jgi:transcription factor IIIB subunit 2
MATHAKARLCCPNCGSTEIEIHEASGASICTECAVVVEENAIVSSIEFVEGAGGASSMVGQFIGANATKPYSRMGGMTGGGRYGFSRDSRETTLANGRRRIQDVASRLRLASHFVDTASRLFTIAVEKNFVQGRRTTHVVAACLYIACRQEKSQHMLIDFSDALQINVYTLGTCFLKFRRLLGLRLEIIDPALYVYRFAAHLDLGDKANAVALTALRLVGRMKRDWIVAGRRPAGICAAALLIAARAHGFTRAHQDVTKVLRVCGLTVINRVKDFEQTPSANLTLDQFNTMDLDMEADPPVFTANRIKEARISAVHDNNLALLESGFLDDRRLGSKRAARWRQLPKETDRQKELNAMYGEIESEMKGISNSIMDDDLDDNDEGNTTIGDVSSILPFTAMAPLTQTMVMGTRNRPILNGATAEELQPSVVLPEDKFNLEQWKESMPETCVDELQDLFNTDEEYLQKQAIFNKINKEYLEQQERKENERMAVETLRREQEEDDVVQGVERAKYMNKSQRFQNRSNTNKRRREDNPESEELFVGAPTTKEALLAAVVKRHSRKINYDALSAIFDDNGSFSTDYLEDNEPLKSLDDTLFSTL